MASRRSCPSSARACAIAFSKQFYGALVGGLPIERAVAAAKPAIIHVKTDPEALTPGQSLSEIRGETLAHIAYEVYGDPRMWRPIARPANAAIHFGSTEIRRAANAGIRQL